jgi:hypothetical protein
MSAPAPAHVCPNCGQALAGNYCSRYLVAIAGGELARIQPAFRMIGFLTFVYLAFALRRLFRQSWMITVVKTLVLSLALILIELAIALTGTILTTVKLGF